MPPSGSRLKRREYRDARVTSFPYPQPRVPVMYLASEGSACDGGSGRFSVKDIHVNAAGAIDRLTILYEISCESRPVLFGEVSASEPPTDAPEVVMPRAIDWPKTPVGTNGDEVPVTIVARENAANVSSIAIKGRDPRDFSVSENTCTGQARSLGARCEVDVATKPRAAGILSAQLVIADKSGAKTTVPLTVSSTHRSE
jgi:hypothetical protein